MPDSASVSDIMEMRRATIFPLGIILCLPVSAQFKATIRSTPDSAVVRLNGSERGHTPCATTFFWRNAQEGMIVIEVSAPGYRTWRDTLDHKPMRLDLDYSVRLERDPPKYDVELVATPVVAFDKLLADLPLGKEIGRAVDKDGKVTTMEWDGPARFGEAAFGRRCEEMLLHAGFKVPGMRKAKLFENDPDRPALPRYSLGAKVVDYHTDQRYSKDKHYGDGPNVGITRLRLQWQVLDRSTGKTVLTEETEGTARERSWTFNGLADNIGAFEDALVAFLNTGKLHQLLKAAPPAAPSASAAGDTLPETVIPQVALLPPGGLSDMIGAAEHSCVTIITDGGHGSGAIISTEGHVLSAYHVVDGVNRIEVLFADGLKQEAKVVSYDEVSDVVLLDISGSGFKPMPIGVPGKLRLGEELVTIGTPAEVVLGQSVAKGILSGRRSLEEGVFLQTDMSVSPGNSGGPLINLAGEIVGIVQRKVVGDAVEGIALAIPIDMAMEKLRLRVTGP